MNITGTNYFPSLMEARAYYKPYAPSQSPKDVAEYVQEKISQREICIGEPGHKHGEILFIRDHRWHIQTKG